VEDNRRLQATISKLRDTTSTQAARLEEELSSKTRSVEILQEKLAAQSDYDEVKRELRSVRPQSLLSLLLYSLPAALRAAQNCRYLIYSEADFEVFRRGDTLHRWG